MMSNILLYKIITRKHDFCCICYKTIEGNPITIDDEVVLNENEPENTIKMQEVLLLVLGYEIFNNVLAFEVLCKKCTHTAVSCYKFITMTRENSTQLSNMLCSLQSCLDNTPKSEENNTLFVTIDSNDYTTQNYYDRQTFSMSSNALKRLICLLDAKTIVKTEPKIIKQEKYCKMKKPLTGRQERSIKTKSNTKDWAIEKKRKNISLPIKTTDMLYDCNDPMTFKCKVCLKSCAALGSLKTHYMRVHAPKNYECSICNKKFGSVSLMEAHKTLSHCTVVCSECGKTFYNRHTLKMHEIGHHLKIVCEDCGRVYKSQSTYKKHIELNVCNQKTRASPADAKFTCDYCNKKYTQKVSLRVHIQYDHGNYIAHECKWCQKRFYSQSKLKAHIVKHTQEKNFPCNMCGGKFITKESLLYHTRRHTGEKPYKCEFCDLRFLSTSRRSDHTRRHHPDMIRR